MSTPDSAQLRNFGTVSGAPVAQSEEQRTFNPRVRRSKRRGGTINSPDQLPANMRSKIQLELCPRPELPGFCWGWTGCLNSRGYGCIAVEGKSQLAHRVAYKLAIGPIPPNLQIDHLCTNKQCCNPSHLEAVTGKVNCERTDVATKIRCVNGHPLIAPNLVLKPRRRSGLTIRNCRVCALDSARRRRLAQGQVGQYSAASRHRAALLAAAETALEAVA